MPDLPFPRGMRDLLPNAALFRNELIGKIEDVFRRFGFLTIDTPMVESLDLLNAKGVIGEDAKLIYELKGDKLGLRYDQTVSLARYMAMHQELPLPFKRYAIGKAWRRDEPQKGRYREFTQADVDIIGGEIAPTDAEVLAVVAKAFDEIGLGYKIKISNRALMNSLLDAFGVKKELHVETMRIIDKLEKLGRDKIVELLESLGLERDPISKIDDLINMKGTNDEKIAFVQKLTTDKSANDLAGLIKLVSSYGIKGSLEVDFSIVRGLDYYTGVVFEFTDPKGALRVSLAGGGRYDNLIGSYGGRSLPAVGVAIGIDTIMDMMNFMESPKYTYARLFIVCVKDSNYQYGLKTANWFRGQGVATDINLASRNISNQLSYANSMKFEYAAVVGDAEEKEGKIKLRNLITGEDISVTPQDALKIINR
ncbi:MAG TPA: histidine--tRNA ligase [Candidatus Acidoferrum sp.]|nr:histidine--tRNA ligase [Candidatus Acidoferrum sp.]